MCFHQQERSVCWSPVALRVLARARWLGASSNAYILVLEIHRRWKPREPRLFEHSIKRKCEAPVGDLTLRFAAHPRCLCTKMWGHFTARSNSSFPSPALTLRREWELGPWASLTWWHLCHFYKFGSGGICPAAYQVDG